jgi:hypothetical protein
LAASTIEHQAFESRVEGRAFQRRAWGVRVEGRGSSIPTSSVGRSSRATGSGSGQCPTVECRADGRGDEFAGLRCRQHRVSSVEHSNVEPGAFESSIGVESGELAFDSRLSREDGRDKTVMSSPACRCFILPSVPRRRWRTEFGYTVTYQWLGEGMRVRFT